MGIRPFPGLGILLKTEVFKVYGIFNSARLLSKNAASIGRVK